MTFISYAQNFEDVMLFRALKHIDHGFYIDVGAWSPDKDSVTKAFYDLGWHGINIEPNPDFINEFRDKRQRDINLCVAAGSCPGEAEMYFVPNSGVSSLKKELLEKSGASYSHYNCMNVTVTTLADLGRQHARSTDVHFMKVDVEGFEKEVLNGNEWSSLRPWVVVVEAMVPNTQIENHAEWEGILLGANYVFAYADGLNRYYVAEERADLLPAFKYPPCVFDNFVSHAQISAQNRAQIEEKRAHAAELEVRRLRATRSWRWTRPFRALTAFFRSGG